MKVGAEAGQEVKEDKIRIWEEWFDEGRDIVEFYEKTRSKHDSQCNRILSTNGICPTICKIEQPFILVSNEVPTNTDPVEIEIEIDRDRQIENPLSLW